ncbi:PREDICTED: protein FAR-RED IMPAIRED RESPONSE 1-like [Prunus mume]|uniref:Protein FAR1-RELATED SEQUENCE n=1 Tax=Prunus mume TaxID=102107 RepID=A0ABM0NRP8_PRUMU|nr:PREDICTED: protein FAR-RED IMPAIRED RESPONSE 1-like [Prunus mume]
MPGKPPKMIITDQDAAMSKAIVVTLPTTFHRNCMWHILNKIREKPGIGECFSEMCKCIWGMDKKEEFDAKYEEIITNNGLQDHALLSSIHAMRENWVPSHVKHVFLAGMSSSQRAENCHSFFKQYINRKNTLMEFIVRFEKVLASQRHKELIADHVDNNKKPPLPFQTPMQHQMGRIYTWEILEMFEREDFRSLLCLFELVEQDEMQCRYEVSEQVNQGVTRMKELVHDKDADKAYCSCKGFEFWGIPCRHILAFLRMKQVEHFPDKYILKRWLQSAKISVIYDKNHKEVNNCVDGLLLVKRSKVYKVASDLIDSTLLCDEGFELLEKSFEDIRGKLTSLVSSRAHVEEPNGFVGTSYPQLRIKDPHRVKVKGRTKRVKVEKEKAAQRRKRRCIECRKTDHDRWSCPKLASPSSSSDTELGGPVRVHSEHAGQ